MQGKRAEAFNVREELFSLSEGGYKLFMSSLLPNVDENKIIGVRTPALRKLAKRILKSDFKDSFLSEPDREYYEEKNIHALIINELDYEECIEKLNSFLPFVDNWGTCDCLRPKCFAFHKHELLGEISKWINSEHAYTVRFAIEMLMLHFLGEDFKKDFFEIISLIRSEEYYLNMMVAWYFATALAQRYDEALPYIKEKRLSPWVHNKTISKATESLRIPKERKAELKTLRIK